MNILSKLSSGESDKEDVLVPDTPSFAGGSSPISKERHANDNNQDITDSESQRTTSRSLSSCNRDCSDSTSTSRESWHGRSCKGYGDLQRNLRLTAKLRDFNKYAKVDAESGKELELWNEMLKNDAVKLCQENNFNTGFFEGSENNSVVDAYELKVRLEHILERIALISEAASTEKPSAVTSYMFIGGALAARSVCDSEDFNITTVFEEACDFIDCVEQKGQKILVHCFEGKSRSVTLVLAYLMLRK
ncbi:hypothetical protein TSUD_71330 [Trifolium subterraneum]|uniref:Tyrosine specific protein phosphatases domain-containing protein n=1 Tax=Trifolium subterraneum TaxID=3900 RepID=A0A2Z6N283_TRISU|nr:hypothetical protein TSUD_71330 [Trifolium subterraneum]